MKEKLLIVITLIVISSTGCYYNNEVDLYGSNCDTTTVTYSTTIRGILNGYGCLGCHSGSSPSGSINLETHTSVKATADIGKLFGAISHASGFSPMPQGAPKMSQCDINKIKAWIDRGSPNN